MEIERRPAKRQIADHIIDQIRAGIIRDGDRLPGRTALMTQWHISGITAQQALELLRDEGWARTEPKVASYAVRKDEA